MELEESLEPVEHLRAALLREALKGDVDSSSPVEARRLHARLVVCPPRPPRKDLGSQLVIVSRPDVELDEQGLQKKSVFAC